MDDTLGDWRLQAALRLGQDLPAAFPGGPSHKKGTPVHLVTSTRGIGNQPIGFVTPSSTALALSIAMNASIQSIERLNQVKYENIISPEGPGKSVNHKDATPLFDYFESCMVAITFSLQAVEAFSNWVIADKVQNTFSIIRDKGVEVMTSAELERKLAIEEKLHIALPNLLGISSPKGKKVWESFKKLKQARDSIVHLKSSDQYPNRMQVGTIDKSSLYFVFLNNKMTIYPTAAIRMIHYFHPSTNESPRWLEKPLEFVKTHQASKT